MTSILATVCCLLEVEMAKREAPKVWVKLRGNVGDYVFGQEIELPEDEAVRLLTLGYATKIDAPVAQAKE